MNITPPAIVVVDDEPAYGHLIGRLLTDHLDCTVHSYTRPLAALEALPELAAGVVVTDYFMPEMDGLEFIRQASPLAPATRFLLMTGHTLQVAPGRLASVPALQGHIAKPFRWRTLADEILRVWPPSLPPPSERIDAAMD